jgi:hypothetical protein
MFENCDMSRLPPPIRIEQDLWVCMREEARVPKALIRRVRVTEKSSGRQIEAYRVTTWDLDAAKRRLVGWGYFPDLLAANDTVIFDNRRVDGRDGPPNGVGPAVRG